MLEYRHLDTRYIKKTLYCCYSLERNIQISPRGASSLGSKFIVYLAIAHDWCSDDITEAMRLRGGYICHLDATTCEGRYPILMSSLDSISQIVLGNNGYTLIRWTLEGKSEGNGYGFPFDRPHLAFAKRIHCLHAHINTLKNAQLRRQYKNNKPYFKIDRDLQKIIKDKVLWNAVEELEKRILIFERLRKAMCIANPCGRRGLNDEGNKTNIKTIEYRVKKFRVWLTSRKDYPQNHDVQRMIAQIDKYWEKLFADPVTVQTASGPIQIQPQRTNNILEQFFRNLKRSNRRKTGNKSSGRMLRTMLAETPLVNNLQNPEYMKILLKEKTSLEELFAEIEIDTLRDELRKAQFSPEKIPVKIKRLIAIPDYPEKLMKMVEKAVTSS